MFFRLKKYFKPALQLLALCLLIATCDDIPAPSGTITAKITSNVVEFSVEVADGDSFEWDFGDSTNSTEQNPIHIYNEYGKDYTVTLKIRGSGGETTLTKVITIPARSNMEILTGGESDSNGRRWRINASIPVIMAKADPTFTVLQNLQAGFLKSLGFANAYEDEFIFSYNGNYKIVPKSEGILAGLTCCTSRHIPNIPPGNEAISKGLTLMIPYTPPQGLKFAFSESRQLTIKVSDGNVSTDVTFDDVMSVSFSKGGFLGINNWLTDCIIISLEEKSMTVALFTSTIPADSPFASQTNGVLIFTFELVE